MKFTYLMKFIYILMLISIIIYFGVVPAFADETEWVDPQEKTLRLKESFARGSFLIEASDFYDNSALITVYDANRNIIARNITRINESFDVDKKINITVINLKEVTGNISAGHGLNVVVDQWARILTRVPGSPLPKISIIPKSMVLNNKSITRRTFIPGSEISINFSIRNDGKAKLKNITLKINSSLPLLYGEKLNHEIYEIGAGNESDVITVRFQAPFTGGRKLYPVSAEVRGNDAFGKAFQTRDSINIEVNPQIGNIIDIRKYVSEKVYIGDVAVVSISIKNNLSQKIENVSLIDSLPAGLKPLDMNLSWNFALGPNELKTVSYKVVPQKPGTYYLQPGSSIIGYRDELYYNTKPAKLIVNGPYVILTKSAIPETAITGDNITIRLDARNIGDSTAIVKLNDSVPVRYSLPSDKYKAVLDTLVIRPGNSTVFSYTVNTTEPGDFSVPPAKATVLDQFLYQDERYTQRTGSNELVIKVRSKATSQLPQSTVATVSANPKRTEVSEATSTTAPEPTATKSSPGFQGYVVSVILIMMTIIIRNKNFKR
ncbi:MAG: hypothetical protein FIB08_06005 [Candidatus Methanoperedens sp.]|nr:hypothetical protein [Candidatus Methanoperedens sp.]